MYTDGTWPEQAFVERCREPEESLVRKVLKDPCAPCHTHMFSLARISRLTVREYLRCVEEPMILLKLHQPFVFGGHTRLECVQLVGKQNRSFFCGLRSRRRFLLVVEANQPVHHRRRQRGIVRSKADLQD